MNDQMKLIIRNLKQKIFATKERIFHQSNELQADNVMLADLIEAYNVLKIHDEPENCCECKKALTPQDRSRNREIGIDHERWNCWKCFNGGEESLI